METIMENSERPCYIPQAELKGQLKLAMKQFVMDGERAYSKVAFQPITLLNHISLHKTKQTLMSVEKLGETVEKACAQLAHNCRLAMTKEEEEKEARNKDKVEKIEPVTKSSHDYNKHFLTIPFPSHVEIHIYRHNNGEVS
ncbi:unnamed protein product [Linum trigynum]|uniref:Uncharacterized protein n=1 Tax=Linum trigynum TaxID=586398 RepID=A0AAV2CKT5_9ROSI